MSAPRFGHAVALVEAMADKSRGKYREAAEADDPAGRMFWSGCVSAYEVALNALHDETLPERFTQTRQPVSTICADCSHPMALHSDADGCTARTMIDSRVRGICGCTG